MKHLDFIETEFIARESALETSRERLVKVCSVQSLCKVLEADSDRCESL